MKAKGRSKRKTSSKASLEQRWKDVPASVRGVYERGWPVIPQVQTSNKRALVKWAKYQKGPLPSRLKIVTWDERWGDSCTWAVVTGRGLDVLDFDGEEGEQTRQRLGLKPTVLTPGGGSHVWIAHVPFRMVGGARIDQERFPGVDLRTLGQTATFNGERRGVGRYKFARGAHTYKYEELPEEVQRLLKRRRRTRRKMAPAQLPDDFKDFTAPHVLLGEALSRLQTQTRNETGFWLACQLRDERYARNTAEAILGQFARLVQNHGPHPYAVGEAYSSVQSAYNQPARAPRLLLDGEVLGLMSEVKIEKLKWLWEWRIPEGKITIIEGDPDRGKSLLTLDLAARVSRGGEMPDGQRIKSGSVIIISAEDDINDTIKPRLAAAKARMTRIGFVKLRKDEKDQIIPLSIPEDLARIGRAMKDLRAKTGVPVKLIIVDPITAYLSEKINTHVDAQVRKAMFPLKQFAEDRHVPVLLVRHLNKEGSLRAMYRGGGTIAFTAAARSVMVVERHPDEEETYVLARVKLNVGPAIRPITYSITTDPKYDAPRIEWGEEIKVDVDELLRGSDDRRNAPTRKEAERVLGELLADGPVPFKEVERAAQAAGISMKSMRSAKEKLRVKAVRVPPKGPLDHWEWKPSWYMKGTRVHFDLS